MENRGRTNAARAAKDDARLTVPQAAELLRQGRLLKRTGYADRKALRQQLGLTEEMAQSLIALVDAEASAGLIAHVGLDVTIRAARAGLELWPDGEITYIYGKSGDDDLIEFFVPSQATYGLVTYYSKTQRVGKRVARSICTLRRPIDIGLTSIAAANAAKVERQEIWDGDHPSPQQIRTEIECMQAAGRLWSGGAP